MVTLDSTASRGYGGVDQSIDEPGWAVISPHIGSAYPVVVGLDDLKVTVATGDRTVRVAAGVSVGFGVSVTLAAAVTLQLAAAPSGSNRWDAIVLRRDWSTDPGGTSSIIVVQNAVNASKTLPAALKSTPGEQYDQLLALVQVSANSTLPTGVDDLRSRATKTYVASSLLALPAPLVGAEAVIGANRTRYYVRPNTSGQPVWLPEPSGYVKESGSAVLEGAANFGSGGQLIRGLRNPATGDTQILVNLRRSTIPLNSDPESGNFADSLMATVTEEYRPDFTFPISGQYWGATSGGDARWAAFQGALGGDGRLTLQTGSARVNMIARPVETRALVSVRALIRFTREV